MRGNGRTRDRHRIAVVRSAADWQHSRAGRVLALALLILAILCVAQGLSKGVLWFAGERTYGEVVAPKTMIHPRGATWVRYSFAAGDGKTYVGSAFTAAKNALRDSVDVAYLPEIPSLNMPAYGAYTFLLGVVWVAVGVSIYRVRRALMR